MGVHRSYRDSNNVFAWPASNMGGKARLILWEIIISRTLMMFCCHEYVAFCSNDVNLSFK